MQRQCVYTFAVLILAMLGMVQPTYAFTDVKADFTNGSFFTASETNVTTAGLKMNGDGTFTRVEADDAGANAVISGKYHSNEHGISNFSATVKVEGPVKVSMGTCAWGGDVTIKNGAGETVGTFNTNTGACYHQDKSSNIAFAYYKGEATTLTISGGSYTPYFAVEAVDASDIPSDIKITYALGNIAAEGTLPANDKAEMGKEYTLPLNRSLYVEGKTLTAWSDGSNTYKPGSKLTAGDKDITLTAVFTDNKVSLGNRTEEVEVTFDFQRKNGAPVLSYQNKTGIYVTQAVVNGEAIDVKLDFDTNNGGKIANGNWNDWCQMNGGTKLVIPSCKGATVSLEAYDPVTTTTIDGQKDYISGKIISYAIANTAATIDVVIGDGSYYRYVKVLLPVVQGGGGKTFDNASANIVWNLNDADNYAIANTVEPDDAFTMTTVSMGDFTVGIGAPDDKDDVPNRGVKMLKLQPTGGDNTNVEFIVKPTKGLTLTTSKVYAKVVRYGTDGGTLNVSAKNGEGKEVTLATGLIPARNNTTKATDKKGSEANWCYEFSLDVPAELATAESFSLVVTESGLATSKQWGIGDVRITGTVNGTTQDVAKYTFAAKVSPEKSGTVNIYPQGIEYDEGTELKLTATKNFGYKFVNWTDNEGNEISTENVFNYTLNANTELTANFEAVNTYELALSVDGTNDYMVAVAPAPTVVNGKNMYEQGTEVKLEANQYEGLVTFTNWSDGDTNGEKTIIMKENTTLTATYVETDIIAGWDFYRAGASGRKADFAAEDNDADVLNLLKTSDPAQVSGWLDKSTVAAGGYESFAGAAVNWREGTKNGDVGYWHWQTKVNAAAFTDINVQFDMLYNYNAYQTYNAEYSLDGETWKQFGSITMTAAKTPASFSEKLPTEADNQASIYIRMLPDKTSKIDGSVSVNDGNALAMFFITGTPKLINDGKAPVLLSTVPAEGATNTSANGRIVLTFDEKVKLAEDAVAYINDAHVNSNTQNPITGKVNGKTVVFDYKALNYATDYQFVLPANNVSDMTDNTLSEAITISFTTMMKPSVNRGQYDFIVPDNGTFKEALQAAAQRPDNSKRYRIFVKKGNYVIPAVGKSYTHDGFTYPYPDPRTSFNSPNVSIIGEDRDLTTITNEMPNSLVDNPDAGKGGMANPIEGIRTSGVLYLTSGAQNTYFQDIKLWSATADGTGRNVVLVDGGNKTICKNVCLWAYQDTYVSDNARNLYYFEGGLLRGRTDFLCGSGDVFYNGVTLQMCEEGGYLAVPRDNVKYGYVFKDCVIKGETSKVDGNYFLGRPWTEGAEVYYIDTRMEAVPYGQGWAEMSDGGCTRMAEYNSTTASGSLIDLSARATKLGKVTQNPNNPILTAEEAEEIGNMKNMFGDWDPTLATEQAPVPTNVKLEGSTLSWDDSNYVFCWAVCKDGNVVDFTTEPTYTVSGEGNWSVRAANEMGGLSEAAAANGSTGIENIVTETANTQDAIYNLQGIRVAKAEKGIYIVNGRKVVVK